MQHVYGSNAATITTGCIEKAIIGHLQVSACCDTFTFRSQPAPPPTTQIDVLACS